MPEFSCSHYYTYDEITALLQGWETEYGAICELSSIGTSLEGRELWLLTVTDPSTGPHSDKPAMWLDANTHAGEVTGCTAVLDFANTVLTGFRSGDPAIARLLETSTLYILPRLCPDGSEQYLTTPYTCRSTPILWPEMPKDIPGFRQADVDGDGHITMMRIRDQGGNYKISGKDSRLMIPRLPEEDEGEFYRLLPEGVYDGWDGDGDPIGAKQGLGGLDANRQYPRGYIPEGGQPGAGNTPMHLVEVEAHIKAVTARNNICVSLSYHTTGRELLHVCQVSDCPGSDAMKMLALVDRCCDVTGYQIRPGLSGGGGGHSLTWGYEHRGQMAFLSEMWSLEKAAGVWERGSKNADANSLEGGGSLDSVGKVEKILEWCDAHLEEGSFFKDWAPCDHPQLGPVEIGGFKYKKLTQNPPEQLLRAECKSNTEFALILARSMPRVVVTEASAKAVAGGLTQITLQLQNTGYMRTSATSQAVVSKAVRAKVPVQIKVSDGLELVAGEKFGEMEHLEGRPGGSAGPMGGAQQVAAGRGNIGANPQVSTLTWLVSGEGEFVVDIDFQRGGVVHEKIAVPKPAPASL